MRASFVGVLLALALSAAPASYASNPSDTGKATITSVQNGWNGEGLAIYVSTPASTGCPANNQFAVAANDPMFNVITAESLTAYSSGSNVHVVFDVANCLFGGRAKIMMVNLTKE